MPNSGGTLFANITLYVVFFSLIVRRLQADDLPDFVALIPKRNACQIATLESYHGLIYRFVMLKCFLPVAWKNHEINASNR